MKNMPITVFITVLLLLQICVVRGQQSNNVRIDELRQRLEIYGYDVPALDKKVSASVSGMSLFEFVRGIAISNKLNLNVDPTLDTSVSINFSEVSIRDLLVHLCKEYNAEILLSGENILSMVRYVSVPPPSLPTPPKTISISYNRMDGTITFDLRNDSLGEVTKQLTQKTGVNVIVSQKLQHMQVSGYVEKLPLKKALIELAHINGLQYSDKDSSVFYIEDVQQGKPVNTDQKLINSGIVAAKIVTNDKDSILSIIAPNAQLKDIVPLVAAKLSVNYFMFSELKGSLDVRVGKMDFASFLKYVFNGTEYTSRYDNGIYLIGERKLENIRTSVVYKLMYRTTNKILEVIPAELRKGIELIPLVDLNSVIISGAAPTVNELQAFLRQIDKSVPVINIELIILDITNTHNISSGISVGIDNSPIISSYASIFPTVDVKLGAGSINNTLNSISGGLINFGNVNANFYLSLKASEDNGLIKIRSMPKLSTLNGSEAHMAIGETRYYAETTANVIATQSTTTVSGVSFKPLQANLSITIKPIVSGDEQITLDISVDQGSFTNQISANGPFGQTTRTFKSSIRVKNNDMILLGGLEQKSTNNSGRGVPILSRIPVLKWLFSSRTRNDSKGKLAILIHPTVIN